MHKCVFYIFPIMLPLCLMPSMMHYAQNYADIIGGSLPLGTIAPLNTAIVATSYPL